MNRTGIEWTDFTWNPVTGCKHGCPYCYAREVANRFPAHFPNGFEPMFRPKRLDEPGRGGPTGSITRSRPSGSWSVGRGAHW